METNISSFFQQQENRNERDKKLRISLENELQKYKIKNMNKVILDHIRKLRETMDIFDGDALEIEGKQN